MYRYTPGKCHPIVNTNTMNVREISRIPTKLKIVTGIYVLQVDRVKFRQNVERSICELCGEAEENLTHFLLSNIFVLWQIFASSTDILRLDYATIV
jgi:hypothetical protein